MKGAEPLKWSQGFDLGPFVRKPINLIQEKRKIFFQVFNFLVKECFAYFCFLRLISSV